MGSRDFKWLWNTMLRGDSSDVVYVMRVVFETKAEVPQTTMQRENRMREVDNLFMNAVLYFNQKSQVMHNTQATECIYVDDKNQFEVFFIGVKVGCALEPSLELWKETALSIIKKSSIGTEKQWVDYVKCISKT
jgi:hypothetical protein